MSNDYADWTNMLEHVGVTWLAHVIATFIHR